MTLYINCCIKAEMLDIAGNDPEKILSDCMEQYDI